MTSPVLPPDIPIVGPNRVQPQWWRWFRDVNDSVSANSAAIVDLEAALGDATATRVADVVLTAGSNVVAHGLGVTPTSWWAARPRGAFPTLAGGVYPNITPPRASASQANATSYTASHTMQFTPADGAILVAVPSVNGSSSTISALTQTGVTWSVIDATSYTINSNSPQLWVGQCSSGASASVGITYTGGAGSNTTSLTVAEIPEITSTTPTAYDSYKFPSVSFPGVRPYDTAQQCATPPVPSAGDIVITAVHCDSTHMPQSAGWPCVSANFAFGSANLDTMMFARVAQEAEHQPFRAISYTWTDVIVVYQACFPTSLSPSGGTIPHGLREVSLDATNLTVDSIGAVTVDLYFK